MSVFRLLGLESISIGTARTTAGMSATLVTVNAIVPDSAFLMIEEASKTEFPIEDSDFPDITSQTAGAKTIQFATQDMTPVSFYRAFGGTTGGTLYKFPVTSLGSNQVCIKAISKLVNGRQCTIDIVNANLRASADLQFAKSKVGTIGFVADILRPVQPTTDAAIQMSWTA